MLANTGPKTGVGALPVMLGARALAVVDFLASTVAFRLFVESW